MPEPKHLIGTDGGVPKPIVDADTLALPTQLSAAIAAAASGAVSTSTAYAAGTPADWDTTPPVTVASALDRLAAQVTKLGAAVPPTPPTKP